MRNSSPPPPPASMKSATVPPAAVSKKPSGSLGIHEELLAAGFHAIAHRAAASAFCGGAGAELCGDDQEEMQHHIGIYSEYRFHRIRSDWTASIPAPHVSTTHQFLSSSKHELGGGHLKQARNMHVLALIGFCNEGKERVLVYEYMPRGTVADHLHKIGRMGNGNPPLSWEQRLKISIGAARGLHYLHTSQHKVIHRDVKSSNILLDESWVAKISDFGLSKMGPGNESFTHVSTGVKGTFGYLDPEYFLTNRLTTKSDVYAFGVVLLEMLTGRPVCVENDQNLATWTIDYMRKGKVDDIVDYSLAGQVSQTCL
ncbi:probable receptor-like protein kinase At5g24010 [Ipomoea triloba]|uniref:probable receptor-like protein kinase At5g24010 n=1 Tax=Ipomoea triloba TaxID=35885 RepID=UPI00125D7EFD|nr:probable receptor-like protein kinase At5g24010 [Ipomoea triloba]